LKRLVSVTNSAEAHVLAEALQREGVTAFVREQPPGLAPGEDAAIWIENDSDEERARGLLGEMRASAPTPEADERSPRKASSGRALLLGLILGGVAASVYWTQSAPTNPRPESWDANEDGRADTWASYGPDGLMIETSFDRNLDGEPDAWHEFDERRWPSAAHYDNDFDGREDYWEKHEDGLPTSYSADNDGDGKRDEWGVWEAGSIKERRWSFKNDAVIDKRAIYRNGHRTREEYDRDRNGTFEEIVHLDEFERVIRREAKE
jgi:hypothetical protein